MRHLLSICFAAILLFNLCGYRLMLHFMQEKHQQHVARQINSGIDETELVSVKVPATLPYYTNSGDFQWTSGEVEMNGIIYQYVKRRIYNDSIEYLCLQDKGKTKLLNARDQFFQLAYDLQTTREKGGGTVQQLKPLMLEYCVWDKPAVIAPLTQLQQHFRPALTKRFPECLKTVPAEPPEMYC